MKIVLATCGTRGDIQPLMALARALTRRSHTAVIAAPPGRTGPGLRPAVALLRRWAATLPPCSGAMPT
ncbi:MAG: glycosyltransferase [Deltaproteobacteria bacterium]|nr:glycosyltransferase [Deltaproteobacteria bacterium]MBW2481703.1 glycosyltransferase [Deltaproteobacteria bacterium]